MPDPDEGYFLRPEPEILPDHSVVPDENLIRPAPTRFTHEVVGETPYSYRDGGEEAGTLAAGTPVVVVAEGDAGACWVVDRRGLRVSVASSCLRPLTF